MGVVLIKWAWLKILRALRARLYLQPHHSKNPRSAPGEPSGQVNCFSFNGATFPCLVFAVSGTLVNDGHC